MFSVQFYVFFLKKIFSADFRPRPEIGSTCQNVGSKIGQIMWTPNGRGVLLLWGITCSYYGRKDLNTYLVPSENRLDMRCTVTAESIWKVSGKSHFWPFWAYFWYTDFERVDFQRIYDDVNGVYMRLPVMMVTLGVSWNIERGPVGLVGARHTPPGHFRPIRITTNSTIFTGKLYSHMKVVIWKSGPHVFFQKSLNISETKRDMKKV